MSNLVMKVPAVVIWLKMVFGVVR